MIENYRSIYGLMVSHLDYDIQKNKANCPSYIVDIVST